MKMISKTLKESIFRRANALIPRLTGRSMPLPYRGPLQVGIFMLMLAHVLAEDPEVQTPDVLTPEVQIPDVLPAEDLLNSVNWDWGTHPIDPVLLEQDWFAAIVDDYVRNDNLIDTNESTALKTLIDQNNSNGGLGPGIGWTTQNNIQDLDTDIGSVLESEIEPFLDVDAAAEVAANGANEAGGFSPPAGIILLWIFVGPIVVIAGLFVLVCVLGLVGWILIIIFYLPFLEIKRVCFQGKSKDEFYTRRRMTHDDRRRRMTHSPPFANLATELGIETCIPRYVQLREPQSPEETSFLSDMKDLTGLSEQGIEYSLALSCVFQIIWCYAGYRLYKWYTQRKNRPVAGPLSGDLDLPERDS